MFRHLSQSQTSAFSSGHSTSDLLCKHYGKTTVYLIQRILSTGWLESYELSRSMIVNPLFSLSSARCACLALWRFLGYTILEGLPMAVQSFFECSFCKPDVFLYFLSRFYRCFVHYNGNSSKQRPSTGQVSFFLQLHVFPATWLLISPLL